MKLIGFVFVLIWYLCWLLLASLLLGKDIQRGFRIRRRFAKTALKAFNIKVHVEGKPYDQGCLYISNHRSMVDPLIELSLIDVYVLSKSEVDGYPLLGKGARETGVVFVDRDSDDSRKAALQTIEKLLSSGKQVLLYPEGTTHGGNLTGDFRKGAFEVANRYNIPVIPIMIEYPDSGYYWTDLSLMEYFKTQFSKPGKLHVHVEIGKPLYAANKDELVSITKSEIDRMILKVRSTRKHSGKTLSTV